VVDGQSVQVQEEGWRVTVQSHGFWSRLISHAESVRLFEVANTPLQNCLVVYRAKMKPDELIGLAYLEMWCRMNGQEFFSKGFGFGQVTSGTAEWETFETPFLLKKGELCDLIRLNVAVKGSGGVLVKDVEVVYAPLREVQTASRR
jgi:hypothetical protein